MGWMKVQISTSVNTDRDDGERALDGVHRYLTQKIHSTRTEYQLVCTYDNGFSSAAIVHVLESRVLLGKSILPLTCVTLNIHRYPAYK